MSLSYKHVFLVGATSGIRAYRTNTAMANKLISIGSEATTIRCHFDRLGAIVAKYDGYKPSRAPFDVLILMSFNALVKG